MNGEALLIYDGECRLCRRAVTLLNAWDRSGRIACMPSQNPLLPRLLPDASAEELDTAMLLVGPRGRRYRGAEALPRILSLLPGGLPLRLLFEVPGLPTLARKVYGWIAGHRHELGCRVPSESAL
jgi:predicted DCC family thiol-disulfide oxidoreductase YuxK